MNKVYIETYGCSANKSDSEIMTGVLKEAGYSISNIKDANYLIVNTCGVKQATENKIIDRLKRLSKTNKKLIVAGCLTKINTNRIKKEIPNFSALVDPKSIDKIADIVDGLKNSGRQIVRFSDKSPEKSLLPKVSFNSVISIIQILEGCSSACTYCGTKLARGSLSSYRPSSVLQAVKQSIESGSKEVWLTSQDNSCYGRDINSNLANLIHGSSSFNEEYFIRVGMMNPLHLKTFLYDLIDAYKNPKVFKFLHIPVQSGSNRILKLMRRGYKVEDYEFYVSRFKEEIPDITISTDIIVGFPSESNSDFERTIRLLKKTRPDVVNLSKYSVRPGTLASKMKNLDSKIIDKRSNKIHKLIKKISKRNNEKWMGWKGKVLIDEIGKRKTMVSRNHSYKPIITSGSLGSFKNVKIVSAEETYLIGK